MPWPAGRWRTSPRKSASRAPAPTAGVGRYRVHGWAGREDRGSRPKSCPHATPKKRLPPRGWNSGKAPWTWHCDAAPGRGPCPGFAPRGQPTAATNATPRGDMIHIDVKKQRLRLPDLSRLPHSASSIWRQTHPDQTPAYLAERQAERSNRTLQEGWAYRQPFSSNKARTDAPQPWLDFYNGRRPYGSLGGKPPNSRCNQRTG